jgi:MPBQ/MSBQ methyltransferase
MEQTERTFAESYDPLIFDAVIREHYEGSGFYNVGYWAAGVETQTEACVALMERLCGFVPRDARRLLDAGCGLGAGTRWMADTFRDTSIVGINCSPAQLDRCRELAPGIPFVTMDAAALEFEDESFDAIVSVEAAMHFETRRSFFEEAHRVLVPGGRLILSDILFAHPYALGAWTCPEQNHLSGARQYRDCLRDAGFDILRFEDATELCWRAFCRTLNRWLRDQQGRGRDFERWIGIAARMEDSVRHYLLAAAEKIG